MGLLKNWPRPGLVNAIGEDVDMTVSNEYAWIIDKIIDCIGQEFRIRGRDGVWILSSARSRRMNNGVHQHRLDFKSVGGRKALSFVHGNDEILIQGWSREYEQINTKKDVPAKNPNELYKNRRKQSDHLRGLEKAPGGNQG